MSNVKSVIDWRKRTKARMVLAMGGKCVCCGYSKCNRNLSFHHLDPKEKDFGLGSVRANILSWARIVSELKKCVLVCHNCHGEIHEGILTLPTNFAKFDDKYTEYTKVEISKVKKIKNISYCKTCSKEIPEKQKFCSQKCNSKFSEKVPWGEIDLLELKKSYSNIEIGKMYNVSEATIRKKLKNFNFQPS